MKTKTYKIYFKFRQYKEWTYHYAELTNEERINLQHSLDAIADYVDVARFRIDEVDTILVNDPILTFETIKKEIAKTLAVSTLP
jgi:hypothetical protein